MGEIQTYFAYESTSMTGITEFISDVNRVERGLSLSLTFRRNLKDQKWAVSLQLIYIVVIHITQETVERVLHIHILAQYGKHNFYLVNMDRVSEQQHQF